MTEQGAGDRGMYEVRGGAAGLLVQYEDLVRVAGRLESTTGRVRQLEERVTELWLAVGAFGGGSASADRIRSRIMEAGHILRTLAAAVDEIADGVRGSARAYAEVEGRVEARLPPVGPYPVNPWIAPGPYPRAEGFPTRRQAEEGLAYPTSEIAMRSVLGLITAAGLGKLRPVEVTTLPGEPEKLQVEGTAAWVLGRSEVLKRENDPGVIEVIEAVGTDGKPAFVVTLPGTQGVGISEGSENVFDFLGVLEPTVEDSRYVTAGVAEALRRAGAEAGDAVILSGYSQGGDHATHVAGNLAAESDYDVAFLLTAGSPTGATDLPPGVPALHLEHVQDWVSAIDGRQNPDTPDRVTMTLTNPVATPEGEDAGLGPAHRLDNYREGAARADASDDASLKASLESLGAAIAAGSVATRHLYRLSREKLPERPERQQRPVRVVQPGPVREQEDDYRPPVGAGR
ncbi:hypothetical protein N2K95_15505 [Arthrobacter zhaoxinii]|uniref:PE-PPE domain-containing protein n=1 Tax=Arthrobacter zhaoxinii TaxID=2964616 RepID=A0ABY5YVZ4_9MICC|nr:hypothetical protein [Arthrobacter zhaoxinii]UWX98813.1 hypothetical protein N2K95_15505 [Arthrobacter zhaoxinii]